MAVSRQKQYYKLVKNISSFTNGQVHIPNEDVVAADSLTALSLTFSPKSGLYRGGSFGFRLDLRGFPDNAPKVICETSIYHPNIDMSGEVCLNLLDDMWSSSVTLEDVVQGILFLFYNPNLEDPLNDLFDGSEAYDDFKEDVRDSLEGNLVAGFPFERNLPDDFVDNEDVEEDSNKTGNTVEKCTSEDTEKEDVIENSMTMLFAEGDANLDNTTGSTNTIENVSQHGNNNSRSDLSNHTEEMNVSPAPSRLTVTSIINYLVGIFSNTRIFLRTKSTLWSLWTYRTIFIFR